MGRLWLAFRVFFDVLVHADRAEQIRQIEAAPPASPPPSPPQAAAPVARPQAARSDALTLLETLQREARLLDFLQENIDAYSDQQVGIAVREVHRGSAAVVQRLFQIAPAVSGVEGEAFTVRGDEGAARIRLVGHVVEARPVTGTLVHAGWQAQRCELPTWNGTPDAANVLAPAEVELSKTTAP